MDRANTELTARMIVTIASVYITPQHATHNLGNVPTDVKPVGQEQTVLGVSIQNSML